MYLKQSRRAGRVYLSIAESYRDGSRVRTRTIESLGYLDQLARDHADPVSWAKSRVHELEGEAASRHEAVSLTLDPEARIRQDGPSGVSLGMGVALAYLRALGVGSFVARHPGGPQAGGTPGAGERVAAAETLELLAAERMLHAVPIHETWRSRSLFPGRCPERFEDVCRSLELLARERDAIVSHLREALEKLRGPRDTASVRLVLSNSVFRMPEGPAGGGIDEVEGGSSGRLCLAIDGQGMPLDYRIVERELDAESVLSLVEDVRSSCGASHVVLVATELPGARRVMSELESHGDGYVLLLPASSYAPDTLAWARDAAGYAPTRNGSYLTKSRRRGSAVAAAATACDAAGGAPMPHPVREVAFRAALGEQAGGSGPFCLVTSEQASDGAIFNLYRELWRVHEPFSLVSADFVSVPYPLGAREHLEAHFLICYVAFLALRLLRQDMGWRYDAAQVADALCRMQGTAVGNGWYLFGYRSKVSDALQEAAGCPVARRLMRRADVTAAVRQMERAIRTRAPRG